MQEPSAVPVRYAYKPKRHEGENDISQSAMDPPVEHGMERSSFRSVETRLCNFPEEIQEEGQKADTYFRDSRT